jgi:hypothetical protein
VLRAGFYARILFNIANHAKALKIEGKIRSTAFQRDYMVDG